MSFGNTHTSLRSQITDESNIKAATEEEVMRWIQEQSQCRVTRVVFPYTGYLDYYISEHGHFFSVRHERYNKRWCANRHKGRETNYGYCYSMEQNGTQMLRKAEKLIYCSFILGEWDEDIEIDFKDGNPKNIHLDNLAERGEYLTEETARRMAKYADVYQKNFNYVMKYIRFVIDIDTEDAEDLTSKAFIYICASGDGVITGDFVALWMYYAKKKAQSFWLLRCKQRIGRLDEMEWLLKHDAPPIGLDILDILPDERWRIAIRDMAEGCPQEYTAQKLGLSVSSVRDFRREAKRYMRKYLSTDRELMKIYG